MWKYFLNTGKKKTVKMDTMYKFCTWLSAELAEWLSSQ
jgi:DNA-binding Xre family transcriptional regulator